MKRSEKIQARQAQDAIEGVQLWIAKVVLHGTIVDTFPLWSASMPDSDTIAAEFLPEPNGGYYVYFAGPFDPLDPKWRVV